MPAHTTGRSDRFQGAPSWPDISFAAVPPSETAVELARAVRRCVFQVQEPELCRCDLITVCRRGGFYPRAVVLPNGRKHDALLVPRQDGSFLIVVDPDAAVNSDRQLSRTVRRVRYRFRIAHEIGHSFFYDRASKPPRRIGPITPEEETFCDRFASALLIPPEAAAREQCTQDGIFRLRREFDVSIEAAARAVANVRTDTAIAGMLWLPHPKTGVRAMRIVWSAGPWFLPKGARLGSSLVDLALADGEANGVEHVKLGTLKGKFYISASRIPGARQMLVIMRLVSESEHGSKARTVQSAMEFARPKIERKTADGKPLCRGV